jgi:hypothetical protein
VPIRVSKPPLIWPCPISSRSGPQASVVKTLYSLYDALVAINVPTDKARAVVDAMDQDMVRVLTTKSDLASLRHELKQEIEASRVALMLELQLLQSSMTIRLGSITVVGLGLLFAALKLT